MSQTPSPMPSSVDKALEYVIRMNITIFIDFALILLWTTIFCFTLYHSQKMRWPLLFPLATLMASFAIFCSLAIRTEMLYQDTNHSPLIVEVIRGKFFLHCWLANGFILIIMITFTAIVYCDWEQNEKQSEKILNA
jgi:hypothetical protein